MSETKKPFLNNIHLFRAFAIICVVAVHTWHIPSKYKEGHEGAYLLVEQIREVFFHDSTTYFVFISGFLFFYLSSNFNVNRYYQSKLKRVLVPYILLTTLLAVSGRVDVAGDHLFDLASVYLGGTAQTQFWYIPFIAVVFLVSPLLLNINFRGVGIVLIAMIPLLGTRTGTDITFWQFAYFAPAYVLGIYCAQNYEVIKNQIEENYYPLIFVAIISSGVLFYLENSAVFFGPVRFNAFETFHYVQKISIIGILIYFFNHFEEGRYKLLDKIATYSFPIFFTHSFAKKLIPTGIIFYNPGNASILTFVSSILYVVSILFLCLFLCMLLKKLLRKYSVYLIGI